MKFNEKIWRNTENNYNNENYTGAILDSIHCLSDLIRDKSELELDGVDLARQAFSLKNAKIKINKLQTKSDKNIQEGIQNLIVGIYQLVRNPRSHEKYTDTQEDADSIISMVSYLYGMINQKLLL